MEVIIAWASAHPILAWSVAGVAALVVLLALAYGLFVLWVIWDNIDRSGTKLVSEGFAVLHDKNIDEVAFIWTVRDSGKFAARDLRVWMNVSTKQKAGRTASWRLNRTVAALAPGELIDFDIRVSRSELTRLSRDFDKGTITLWSHYSSSSPRKPPKPFGASGPNAHYTLTVGEIGGEACVTVTDFTPIDPYRRISKD